MANNAINPDGYGNVMCTKGRWGINGVRGSMGSESLIL